MSDSAQRPAAAGLIERRVEAKGLRPRIAASVIAALWLVAIVVFGIVEHLVEPEAFNTVWSGMWWATQTVTTVGYGDVVPRDGAGQLIATILMVGGLSLFAVITGTITTAFVTRIQTERRQGAEQQLDAKVDQLMSELRELREQLAASGRTPPSGPQSRS